MPWHLRKTTKCIFSFFFECWRLWCGGIWIGAGCGPSMMCSLESCLSAGVTIYWRMWVTDNITSLCIKKEKKNIYIYPRRNLFNKVCVGATSRALGADAGRPEFSHRGKVINMLYIDVVLSVIGLWEIISTLHVASDAAMCLYVSDLRRQACISFDQSLCAGSAKHADVSPFLQPSAILWWHFAAASEMKRLLLSAHTWYHGYTVDLVIFMLLFLFFLLLFGHWLCKSCSPLISVGLFSGIYASKQGVARCCRICNASWDKTACLGKRRAVPHRDCRAPLKILWKWGEIVARTATEAPDLKFWTDWKGIGAKGIRIFEFLTWHDIKNWMLVHFFHSELRSSSNKTFLCTLHQNISGCNMMVTFGRL